MDFSGLIEKFDKSDMLSLIRKFPEHVKEAWEIGKNFKIPGDFVGREFSNILVIGIGGSGISGLLLRGFLEQNGAIPVCVSNSYFPPVFVDEKTLVFAVSYSGDTEETLSGFECVKNAGAKIIGISSGGELEKICKNQELHQRLRHIKIPAENPARMMLAYTFIPMLSVLDKLGLIKIEDAIEKTSELLKNNIERFEQNGMEIALELKGKIPIVYSSYPYEAVAYRWRTQFSENSKVFSAHVVIPEMNHNDINIEPKGGDFAFIFLRNANEFPRISKRIELTKQVFGQYGKVIEVDCLGNSFLETALSGSVIGDFASYYLALLNERDPTTVERIQWLKKELKN